MGNLWLLLILVIPVMWPWVSKMIWPHNVKLWEVLVNVAIVIAITTGSWFLGMYGETIDHEIWNGQVTKKEKVRVSCSHSYPCNCRTTSCGKGCTTTTCDTCYEHTNDWDWRVYSNVNDYENISRVDRRGSYEPPRWTAVKIGEPYADNKRFTNYIKGAPSSLFNSKDLVTKYQKLIPPYPDNIYDYYRVNHIAVAGIMIPDFKEWNTDLANILRTLGPKKKSNVVIVFANTNQVAYSKALKEAWLGGKKNDTVIVIGSTQYPNIDFVDCWGWSKNGLVNVNLRNKIMDVGKINRDKIIPIVYDEINRNFNKRSMEEFTYLKDQRVPPTWLIIVTAIVSLLVSGGVSWYMIENEY